MKRLLLVLMISLPVFGQTTAAPAIIPRAAARFLDQATWGPTPDSITALANEGIENWLTLQFEATPSDLPDQAILESDGKSNNDLTPVQAAFFMNAINGPDQLRQRMSANVTCKRRCAVCPKPSAPPCCCVKWKA